MKRRLGARDGGGPGPTHADSALRPIFSRVRPSFASLLLIAFALPFLLTPADLHAQSSNDSATLSGRVVLGLTGEPAVGAEVILQEQDRRELTGEEGAFHFGGLTPGQATVEIHYLGRSSFPVTVRLVSGDPALVELAIAGPMFQMEEILVEVRGIAAAKLRGFEERKGRRTGFFITRSDIEDADPIYPSNMLDGVGGARAVQDLDGRRKVMVGAGRNACEPDLYLDGSPIQGAWLDDYLPNLIEAIEFYPRWHNRPPQFRSVPQRSNATLAPTAQETCGAIIVWTRESM